METAKNSPEKQPAAKQAAKKGNDKDTITLYHSLSSAMLELQRVKPEKRENHHLSRLTKELKADYDKKQPQGKKAVGSRTLFIQGHNPRVVKIVEGLTVPDEVIKAISENTIKKHKLF